MGNLELKIKAIKDLNDEIAALYKIVRAENTTKKVRNELITKISLKTVDIANLKAEIDEALAIAGLTTRTLR